jgi:serine acetyltransferase
VDRVIDVSRLVQFRSEPIGRLNKLICYACRRPKSFLATLVKAVFHIELPAGALLRLPHPYGVVINGDAKLGSNVTVFQHVTVGYNAIGQAKGIPEIGDDVILYPNSVVVGGIRIGNRAIVGAGAVVVRDVPDGAVVAGNPARVTGFQQE